MDLRKLLILGLVCLFFSCDGFDGDQDVPSYIRVEKFTVVEDVNLPIGAQDLGFLSSNITDVWVFVDREYVGAYTLPCSIPLLYEGTKMLEFRPGIKLNGMSLTRQYYPFYTKVTTSVDLVKGKEVSIDSILGGSLPIAYDKKSAFSWVEDFDSYRLSFVGVPNQDSTIVMHKTCSPDTVLFKGHKGGICSGAMYMDASQQSYTLMSADSIVCRNKDVMILELDYWGNTPFEIGIYGAATSQSSKEFVPTMQIKESEDKGWSKIYVVLGKSWSYLNYTEKFQVYFRPLNPNQLSDRWVYLDNIKVVHFVN